MFGRLPGPSVQSIQLPSQLRYPLSGVHAGRKPSGLVVGPASVLILALLAALTGPAYGVSALACECDDVSPPLTWKLNTCALQVSAGNCGERKRVRDGFCRLSCDHCAVRKCLVGSYEANPSNPESGDICRAVGSWSCPRRCVKHPDGAAPYCYLAGTKSPCDITALDASKTSSSSHVNKAQAATVSSVLDDLTVELGHLKFFLYDVGPKVRCTYQSEIYDILSRHAWRTSKPEDAGWFFVLYGNEANYPKYDRQGCPRRVAIPDGDLHGLRAACRKANETLAHFGAKKASGQRRPHVVMYASTDTKLTGMCSQLFNIPYWVQGPELTVEEPPFSFARSWPSGFDPKRDVVMPPPGLNVSGVLRGCPTAEAELSVSELISSQLRGAAVPTFRLTFKGAATRGKMWGSSRDYRKEVFDVLRRDAHNGRDVLILDHDHGPDYRVLLSQSKFSLLIELPWTYRLLEVIDSGAIPVIIMGRLSAATLPFSQLIDWARAAVLVHTSNVSNVLQITTRISKEEVADRRRYLFEVHKRFLCDRSKQVDAMLRIMASFPSARITT